ncbi:MAG: hypothetical protein BGO77_03200 [Caedibacter sp. 37-49]|nr:MAG: hypothetical protein BGO77_03200 [Caedibacter sp. 37-49]
MHNFKYQPFLKAVVCISFLLNTSALTASPISSEEHSISEVTKSKQSKSEWLAIIDYSYNYIKQQQDALIVEKNESGFYRIYLPAPGSLKSVEKLRLHYWPIDSSTQILEESIHDHPKLFESYIVNGGYRHVLYNKSDTLAASALDNSKYTIFKVNKLQKGFDVVGQTYLHETQIEKAREKAIVVMPTDVIHRVLTYVPGTLSMNIVYEDRTNKDYYNVFISENGSEKDVKTERASLVGTEKASIIKEVLARLFNSIFQREE